MHINRFAAVLVSGLFLVTAEAIAADRPHYYLGADLGYSFVDLDDAERDLRAIADGTELRVSSDDDSFAFMLSAGAAITRHLALEFNYFDLGEHEARLRSGDATVRTDTMETSGYGARLIATLPVAERWQLDFSAGLAYLKTRRDVDAVTEEDSRRETENQGVPNVGVSGRYHVTRDWSIRGSLMHFSNVGDSDTTGEGDIQLATLGLLYRF